MTNKQDSAGPLGGWFGTIGGFAGMGLALSMGGGMEPLSLLIFTIIAGAIGGSIGLFVENVVARVLIILVIIIEFLARHMIWATIKTAFFGG